MQLKSLNKTFFMSLNQSQILAFHVHVRDNAHDPVHVHHDVLVVLRDILDQVVLLGNHVLAVLLDSLAVDILVVVVVLLDNLVEDILAVDIPAVVALLGIIVEVVLPDILAVLDNLT